MRNSPNLYPTLLEAVLYSNPPHARIFRGRSTPKPERVEPNFRYALGSSAAWFGRLLSPRKEEAPTFVVGTSTHQLALPPSGPLSGLRRRGNGTGSPGSPYRPRRQRARRARRSARPSPAREGSRSGSASKAP